MINTVYLADCCHSRAREDKREHLIFADASPHADLGVVSPECFGARADGSSSSSVRNTAAIQAAAATGKKVVFSAGTYVADGLQLTSAHSGLNWEGAGKNKTKIICRNPGVHTISLASVSKFRIARMAISGNYSNGCGIYGDGVVWYLLEDLLIDANGSHGIHLLGGSYIGAIRDCMISGNKGDGIYQVATSGGSQQNASYIYNNELRQNANGLTIWGYNIIVRENIIEGNVGFGARIRNGLTSNPYTASSLAVKDNYFEDNPSGHIRVETGALTCGVITGLEIENNYGYQDLTVPGVGFKAVSFVSGGHENEVRALTYRRNNRFGTANGTPAVIADFGGSLGFDCRIEPMFDLNAADLDVSKVAAQYINLGYAKLDYMQSKTLSGYFLAKGGSGIAYSETNRSDSITVSGSYTYFPIDLPLYADIFKIVVPVDTDSTEYTVGMNVMSKGYGATAEHAPRISFSKAGSGSGLIDSGAALVYTTNHRQSLASLDTILKLSVTLTTPGTYFRFGNPTVFYR